MDACAGNVTDVCKIGQELLMSVRNFSQCIHTENTEQLRSGLWLIEADGHCGQMSVEYDQVRLAATGF